MANQRYLSALLNDRRAWQILHASLPRTDLSDADLAGIDLTGIDLSRADLPRAKLTGAKLTGANLGGADLHGADLCGANLRGANLTGADLVSAKLIDAKLVNAHLVRARLIRADLTGADLSGANLGNDNLLGTKRADARTKLAFAAFGRSDLTRAKLIRTKLTNARLTCAHLTRAELTDANLSGADLRGVDLTGAKLTRADLSGADLTDADLSGAKLGGADLSGADLTHAKLIDTDLTRAKLIGAVLAGVYLTRAKLIKAGLHEADLRQASLIDSNLDGADLTGAKLWEAQHGGWSIKGIICQQAFWDRDGERPTEYGDGEFERIYAEKPRIVLRYPGGMSPVDFAMLPLIVERLQVDHPGCALHVRSVQDDGGGATVTITVDDLASRSAEAFAQDVEALRGDLASLQQRLQQEEKLRLEFEASYRAVVEDVLPRLLERALPKQEITIGHLTGPTIIEGTAMSRDTYNIHGQTGAIGPYAHAHSMTFQKVWSHGDPDFPKLTEELARLHAALRQEGEGKPEQDKALGAVAAAGEAAAQGNGLATLQHLKGASTWALGIAEKIGVPLAVEALKKAMLTGS